MCICQLDKVMNPDLGCTWSRGGLLGKVLFYLIQFDTKSSYVSVPKTWNNVGLSERIRLFLSDKRGDLHSLLHALSSVHSQLSQLLRWSCDWSCCRKSAQKALNSVMKNVPQSNPHLVLSSGLSLPTLKDVFNTPSLVKANTFQQRPPSMTTALREYYKRF